MKPFRCTNPDCSTDPTGLPRHDFWSAEPKCQKCGADGRDPESQHYIIRLEIIHFQARTKWRKGTGKKACDGKPITGTATGDPTQVNCLACKTTEVWKAAVAEWNYEPIVEITPERAEELRTAAMTTLRKKGAVEKKEKVTP